MTPQQPWEHLVRTIADFPSPGIQFKDVTPLLADPNGLKAVIDAFAERYRGQQIDAIVGMESRGFIFGTPVAYALNVGFIPVRKPNKLPAATIGVDYELEYGSNRLEIHQDALQKGDRVIVLDDVLATGGTAAATVQLIEQLGAEVLECAFVIELDFLNGREQLADHSVWSLLHY